MWIGYVRVSKNDGSQKLDLQIDALKAAGVLEENIYQDYASGAKELREGLSAMLKALRPGDTVVVWRMDRIGRSALHLMHLIKSFLDKNIVLKILEGLGSDIDMRSPEGKLRWGNDVIVGRI